MTAAPGQADPAADPSCPQCGYSRAGLDAAQLCPECGAPAPPPTDLLPIDAANAMWVADIRNGLRLVLVALVIGLVTVIVSVGLSAVLRSMDAIDVVFSIGAVVSSILVARGWWVATRPEPYASISGRRHLIGVGVRVSAIGAAVAIGGGAIIVSVSTLLGAGSATDVLVRAVSVAAGIAGVVHVPAAMAFELHIARLSRDTRLAKSCKQGTWLIPVSHAVYGATALDPRGHAWLRSFGGSLPSSIIGLFLAMVALIASIVTLITPFAYALFTWRAYRQVRASMHRREAAAAAARTAAVAAP